MSIKTLRVGRAQLDQVSLLFEIRSTKPMVVLSFVQKKRGDAGMKAEDKESRNEELKPRSIHLPTWLWERLDTDARRCKRSATKQLEAILTLCYDPAVNLEINKEIVTEAFHAVSQKQRTKKVA